MPFTKTCKRPTPSPLSPRPPVLEAALQSKLANKLSRIEGRAVECVPVDIERGCPLLALIDAHDKCKGFRILVDIHFFEAHAPFPQEVPGCAGIFAAPSGVHSDMFWFQRSTSFRAGSCTVTA